MYNINETYDCIVSFLLLIRVIVNRVENGKKSFLFWSYNVDDMDYSIVSSIVLQSRHVHRNCFVSCNLLQVGISYVPTVMRIIYIFIASAWKHIWL